jgi:serine/threonine-protein kinase HipA
MILRAHAKRRQETRRAGGGGEISALNPLDFLLAVDDVSRVGALRLANAAWLKARTSW